MARFARDIIDFEPVSQGEDCRSIADPRGTPALRSRRRRVFTGVLLSCGVASALVWSKRSVGPCTPARDAKEPEPASLLELAESYPRELMNLGGHKPEEHTDSLAKWLSSATAAGELVDNGDVSQEWAAKAASAIEVSLNSDDPVERERHVRRALQQAVKLSQDKRQMLKDVFDGDLSKASGFLANISKQAPVALAGNAAAPGPSPAKQAQIAACVFDTLSITNIVASLGANINDMARTCEGVKGNEFLDKENAHAKVCAVNSFAVIINFLSLATSLATAADTCALTIIPNVDAVCSAAVTGLTTAVAQIGGSATLIASSCSKNGWYSKVPAGVVPSNVGSNERYRAKIGASDRRLADLVPFSELPDESAPARQLLFGGGKGSLATQCATEIMGTAWQIAYLGLNINSAANSEAGATCPPPGADGEGIIKGPLFKLRQSLCTADISSALVSFFVIIVYLQLIAVTCTDELNLQAICGSGITGLFAAMAGITKAAVGLHVACDVAQNPFIKPLVELARLIEGLAGSDQVSGLLSGGGLSTGEYRRLSEELEFLKPEVDELKQRFATPAEAWASIGYDIEDPHAEFLKDQMDAIGAFSKKDLLALLEKPEPEAIASSIGLFEAVSVTCA